MSDVKTIKQNARQAFRKAVYAKCNEMVGITPDEMADWNEWEWFQSWWDNDGKLDDQDWFEMMWDIFVEANDMDPDVFGDLMARMQPIRYLDPNSETYRCM